MYICIVTSEIIYKNYKNNLLNDELIEFTSILLKEDEGMIEYISIYHKYIKPIDIMNINEECWEEKGIKKDMIKNEGILFEEFIDDYYEWIYKYRESDEKIIMVTIDNQIIYLLNERGKKLKKEIMKEFVSHYMIKDIYKNIYGNNNKNITLASILFELGLSLHIRYSGCIDDCRSIANIIEKVYLEHKNKILNLFNLSRI